MPLANMHPEDVKAGLRKRFGSVAAFEAVRNLPTKSVSDVLRGRTSARVSLAIEEALATPVTLPVQSEVSDSSADHPAAHRLNSAAQ